MSERTIRPAEGGGRPAPAGEAALARLVQDAVDEGATTVEAIHRRIAALPLSALEELGLFERTARDVRTLQDASIGAVYELVRDVNRRVGGLARALLARRP